MRSLFEVGVTHHGKGIVQYQWQSDGNYCASCGSNGLLQVFDRHGVQVSEVSLTSPGQVIALDWDRDCDVLAILQENNSSVSLFDLQSRKFTLLETNAKDLRCISWSKQGPELAIGTGNGNLVIYNKDTRRQEMIAGKHAGPITSVVWNSSENTFALGSDDKTISISSSDGVSVDQYNLKQRPQQVYFAPKNSETWFLSAMINNESIALCPRTGSSAIVKFPQRYGKIVTYCWVSPKLIAVGFSTGYVIVASVETDRLGEELFAERLHRTSLTGLVYSSSMNRIASCGDGSICVVDCDIWKEEKSDSVDLESEQGNLIRLSWTDDGQILSVSTKSGKTIHYLTKMPMVHAGSGQHVAYLSALREMAVVNALDLQRGVRVSPIRVKTTVEPSFVALSDHVIAVGMNNHAYFYRFLNADGTEANAEEPISDQEYLSSVSQIKLSGDYCAALCSGKVYLHSIIPSGSATNSSHNQVWEIFPRDQSSATCVALTSSFLIYASNDGSIVFHIASAPRSEPVAVYKHTCNVRMLFPNQAGTRLIFVDDLGETYMYNPVDSQTFEVPGIYGSASKVLWDYIDVNVFAVVDANEIATFVYAPLTVNGPLVSKLGILTVDTNGDVQTEEITTQLPNGYVPISLFGGVVTCQASSSQLAKVVLVTHESIHAEEMSKEDSEAKFCQCVALRKLSDAWKHGITLDSRNHWLALGNRALDEMNVTIATGVWRQLGDAGMVQALETIRFVEDKKLLAGHIASLFGDYGEAQELFLVSSVPTEALTLRKDLFQWEQALKLAETIAPQEIPGISAEFAQQLEFKAEYKQSLDMYTSALNGFGSEPEGKHEEIDEGDKTAVKEQYYRQLCVAGIARMTLRVGNIPKGVKLAMDANEPNLSKECADILVSLNQLSDAAKLYERAGCLEDAARIHIRAKNFKAAQPLLAKVTSPKLHLELAKAKEAEKDFQAAVFEYEKAKDMDSVVRLMIEQLRQPEKAFGIVRKYQSAVGAEMAARYCQSVNDFSGAIEFLLLAKRNNDAFELAVTYDTMDVFEMSLGGNGTPDEYREIAKFYETKRNWPKAAEFYASCGQYHKALKLYLQCGESELNKAIDIVGRARNDMLTHSMIEYLMGESTGVVQNPVYIFRLYLALGNYQQAARTALVISHKEREDGNYKAAHTMLFDTHHELEMRNLKVPQSLRSAFLLLHSYLLVKKRIKVDDHLGAARLLHRVAKNISKFPAHMVAILTSTVVECHRANLKLTAFEYASLLMRPEYRNEVDAKFKRKIESIVRKRGPDTEDLPEERSPCPYTGDMIGSYELMCPTTKNQIPFCVVTGKHMVLDDWCICPNSRMPALYSEYVAYLQNVKNDEERVDPVCGLPVSLAQLQKEHDPSQYLEYYTRGGGDEGDE